MINVQNNFNGITNSSSNQTENRQGPLSSDVKAFERVMSEKTADERATQQRWQENAAPLNERVRPDGASKADRQASTDSLFSMSGKADAAAPMRTNTPQHESNIRSMHDLETGGLRTNESSVESLSGAMKGSDFIDALFRNAGGANMATTGAGQAAPTQGAMTDGEALEALVSRILVSTPDKGGSEVRLILSDTAFRGTEVSIMRDTTGALTVKIVSSDPSAFQTLVSSRNELLSALQAEEKAPVTVSMEEDKGDANDNDSQRRSRGLDQLDEDLR